MGSTEAENGLPMKDKGADSSPTNKEREKFNVASVARNIPSRRSENEWSKRYCCGVREASWSMKAAKAVGRTGLTNVNRRK